METTPARSSRGERRPQRQVTRRETFGPFTVLHCDDATVWLKGSLPGAGGFQRRRPNAALTVDRLRELVCAIDVAPDHATLGALETRIAQQYVGDYCARELLAYLPQRGRALGDAPASRPPTLPPAA